MKFLKFWTCDFEMSYLHIPREWESSIYMTKKIKVGTFFRKKIGYNFIRIMIWVFRKTDLFAIAIIGVVVPSLIMISLFLRILESFFSSFLLCLWQRPSLPRKKKSIVVRGFKTFPKVKTFFSFSTPNRLFFLFKHGLFQKYKSNGELIACIILTKFEKMKIFSVSQTKIYFLFFKNHTVGPNHKSNDEKLTHFDFDTKTSKNSFFFKTST